ncbi:MAG: hypothetical protein LAT82_01050 [Nanoarchaeota archaeon]|nr:hypothetical protein [Nanoarchaeota archaeon]
MESKNKLLILTLLISTLLVLFSLTIVSYFFLSFETNNSLINFFVTYHLLFMFIVTILSLIIGAYSYFIISKDLYEYSKIKKDLINEFINFLDKDEKEIIDFLLLNNGVSTQYELQQISNSHKVKLHRLLEKLEERKIIEKKKIGKMNKIYLNKQLLY